MFNTGLETENIVRWLQDQVKQAGVSGLVVGLSGGIDSSVAAALIQRAVGHRALGLILPISSNPEDGEHGKMAAKAAGLAHITLDLSETQKGIMSHLTRALESIGCEVPGRMADANLRARLRMSTIYAAANSLGALVVGTDNAAELYTGYFTKYGDGGCDILPLAQYTKAEVGKLGAYLGVPEPILQKPPSAGLWPGQTDEAEMGLTYDIIDRYLLGERIPEPSRQRIELLHRQSQHKRELPPIYQRHNLQ